MVLPSKVSGERMQKEGVSVLSKLVFSSPRVFEILEQLGMYTENALSPLLAPPTLV